MNIVTSVDILQAPRLAPVQLTCGDVAVALTTSPFEDVPWMSCFVVLTTVEADAQVVMIVTCQHLSAEPGRKTVHLVYATEKFRRERSCDDASMTAAVAIGKWLFSSGGLTHHSPQRSAAGDRWARAVSGDDLPDIATPDGDHDSEASGAAIVAMLNATSWPSLPVNG